MSRVKGVREFNRKKWVLEMSVKIEYGVLNTLSFARKGLTSNPKSETQA